MRDLGQGLALKAEGQRRAQNNNDLWKERALAAVKDLCQANPLFNADDVAEVLPPTPKTMSRNIISTVMTSALSAGFCKQLVYSTPSERPERHGNKIFWYGSCIAGGGLNGCRRCNTTGLTHEIDRDAGIVYSELCDCPVGRDEKFRQIVFNHYEGKDS